MCIPNTTCSKRLIPLWGAPRFINLQVEERRFFWGGGQQYSWSKGGSVFKDTGMRGLELIRAVTSVMKVVSNSMYKMRWSILEEHTVKDVTVITIIRSHELPIWNGKNHLHCYFWRYFSKLTEPQLKASMFNSLSSANENLYHSLSGSAFLNLK